MQTQLKLDIDCKDAKTINSVKDNLKKDIKFLKEVFGFNLLRSEICKTKNGYHFYIFTDTVLTNADVCFMQLFLGSDKRREAFNWRRIKDKKYNLDWNILFIEKYENGNLVSREEERKAIKLSV